MDTSTNSNSNGHASTSVAKQVFSLPQLLSKSIGTVAGVVDQFRTQQVPASPVATTSVDELAIAAGMTVGELVAILTHDNGDTAHVVQSINSEHHSLLAKVVRRLLEGVCYLIPPIIGYFAGGAIGLNYSHAPLNIADYTNGMFYSIAWGIEFTLYGLMVGMSIQYKRVLNRSGASGVVMLLVLLALFALCAVGSAKALWAIFETHSNLADPTQYTTAVIRTYGGPVVDFACSVILAAINVVSYQQKIAEIREKNTAVTAINQAKIEERVRIITQASHVKSDLQKEENHQKMLSTAQTIIDLQSENAINAVRDALHGSGTSSSNGNGAWRDIRRS